jgi:hypothetical protein
MGFLTEMLAVAVVWLSSFALCQFGVAVEHRACSHAKSPPQSKTVARTPRVGKIMPVAVVAPAKSSKVSPREA